MLQKWCETAYVDGVSSLYESRFRKGHFIFWAIVMLSMLSCSLYFTYLTIKSYTETPEVTNVALHREPELDMPSILICSDGGYNISALEQSNFSQKFIQDFSHVMAGLSPVNTPGVDASIYELRKYMKENNATTIDIVRKHGYPCDSLISYVKRPEMIPKEEGCELSTGATLRYGNCYLFENNRQQWYPHFEGGLKFRLKSPNDSFAVRYPKTAFKKSVTEGFKVYIEKAFDDILSARETVVPINAKVAITLNTKRYVRHKGCLGGKDQTTSNSCFYRCYLNEFVRACGCQSMYFDRFGSTAKRCEIFFSCSNASKANIQECNKNCLPICDEWIFEHTLTYSHFDESARKYRESELFIGYNSMQYTQIEIVAAFTIDMAIANVGGQSGLWLGVSIVSIVQAIYYLVLSGFTSFRTRRGVRATDSLSTCSKSEISPKPN